MWQDHSREFKCDICGKTVKHDEYPLFPRRWLLVGDGAFSEKLDDYLLLKGWGGKPRRQLEATRRASVYEYTRICDECAEPIDRLISDMMEDKKDERDNNEQSEEQVVLQ